MSNFDDCEEENDADNGAEPLKYGFDCIEWLPPLTNTNDSPTLPSHQDQVEVLPLLPLCGIVYPPNTEHVLDVTEPAYLQMYNDILKNDTKRFVVTMCHPEQESTFAKVGVVYELKELKEIRGDAAEDPIKYICNHEVTGRVLLNRILNPEALMSGDTYLRVEGTIFGEADMEAIEEGDSHSQDESKTSTGSSKSLMDPTPSLFYEEERRLQESFKLLVDKQHELDEDVMFNSSQNLCVASGKGENSLWNTVRLWQSFIEERLGGIQNEMQREFQKKVIAFLEQGEGLEEFDLPSTVDFDDLPPSLQQEVDHHQQRMQVELRPLLLESSLTVQKMLETKDHKARLELLCIFINNERKRLEAKSALKRMFAGLSKTVLTEENAHVLELQDNISRLLEEEYKKKDQEILLMDEPNSFQ